MGVDISHIVKHGFHDVKNRKASLDFAKKAIERVTEVLRLEPDDFEIEDWGQGDDVYIFIICNTYDVHFILRDGYWNICSLWHYHHITLHEKDYFWVRCCAYDLVRALGEEEAWHAEDNYTDNTPEFDYDEGNFEEWLAFAKKVFKGNIPEFDVQKIYAEGDVRFPKCEPIYHDSFTECKEQFESLQKRLGDTRLLGLFRFNHNGECYRCEKDGKVIYVDADTLQPKD